MKTKRFIAFFLSVVMIVTLLPLSGIAAENSISNITETTDGMVLTKSAELQSDGTYKITLEAFATGQTTTSITTNGIPMDIALVLDQSGSMMDPVSTTAVDRTSAEVLELGKVPGAYVVQGEYSDAGYYLYHAVQYVDGVWKYDSDTEDTTYSLATLSSDVPIYLSRLGALSMALNDFVDAILADTTAYDSYVDHRIAMIGYGFGPKSGQTSYGFVSPDSNTSQSGEGFVNTGLYVNGTLENYSYYASGVADFDPETYTPHYVVVSSTSRPVVFYCDNCDGWYTADHVSTTYCNSSYYRGTKYTPKTSETGSGTQFYDLVGHTLQMYQDALVSVNDGSNNLTSSISTAISNIGAYGATYVGYGIDIAKNVFKYNPLDATETRKRIVVVFSDGACEDENIAMAMDNAAELTSDAYNATIYSVGLFSSSEETTEIKNFMHAISSNYPSASYNGSSYTFGEGSWIPVYELEAGGSYYIKTGTGGTYSDYTPITYSNRTWYDQNKNVITPMTSKDDTTGTQVYISHYMSASSASALNSIFTSIATTATSSSTSVTLDKQAVLKDVLNPGLFELSDDYNVTISTQAITTTNGSTYIPGALKNFTTTDGISYFNGDETLTLTVDKENNTIDVTGFDYAAKYVSMGHPGEKIIVTITGVTALDAAATGGYVYTNNIDTSGIYDGGYIVAVFPKPQVLIPCKSFVLDYAKQVNFNAADLGLTEIKDICMTLEEFDAKSMDVSAKNQKLTYGTMTYSSGSTGTFTYAPLTTDWSGYDSFYVFGLNTTGAYEWIKVSVMPANNVYYEDDFVTSTDSGTVGIVYSGEWTVEGSSSNNTENPNGDIHGWESTLANDNGYSDGSSHISSTAGASATFTFTGTGVDIYSRTNMQTGMIVAILTREGEQVANMVLMVDNLAASGDYYQIPTLSINTIFDEETQQEIDMPYGTYTLQLMVSSAYTIDAEGNFVLDDAGNPEVRSTYYLDGIRVYNPLQSSEGDTIVNDAYGEDELNAIFTEVRDLLIDAGSFGKPTESTDASTVTTSPSGISWTKVELSEITASDTIAITMTKDNSTWALYNGNGTGSAPTAVVVSVDGNTMISDDADTLSWNIVSDDTGLIIYVAGGTNTWLYSTNTNNGTRVGTNANKYWEVDTASGYLKHIATSRYLGVYTTNPDWRCYNNTTGNTVNQTLSFWKLNVSTGDDTCEHNYESTVTAPTCGVDGYTTYTCSKCGDIYTGDTVEATGNHNYVNGACSTCGAVESDTFAATLVTDATTLQAGEQIIIVAKGYDYAMGAQSSNGNNRLTAPVTFNSDGKIVTFTADTQVITLVDGTSGGTFAFDVGELGYLYAASSASNYLKSTVSLTANASWAVSIDADTGVASIVAQGTNTHNIIRYNNVSSLFSCYAAENSQLDVCIYRIKDLGSEDSGDGGDDGGDTGDNAEEINVTGFVFIDQVADKTTGQNVNVIGTYENYGPKNEVYLAPGQSIAFRVDGTSGNNYYVGLKAPELDDTATTDIDESQVTVRYSGYGGTDKTISHSTDLYYKLTPNSDGYVIIMNVSGGMLSVTKLRTTGPSASGLMLLSMTESEVIEQTTIFAMARENSSKPADPEVFPDGSSKPANPEVTPDVEHPDQKPNEYAWLDTLVENLFKSLLKWFRA